MSVEIQAAHAAHGHGDMAHGEISLSGYLTGFILSVILTAGPFYLVMTGVLGDKQSTALVIAAFAAVQIVVHMIFFLHMNTSSEGGWTMMALIFTIIMVVIAMTGSLWVMHHLNVNMMPTHEMGRMQ
jgi:cytochrome o ubiquinol oxidase operon protein cyoD